MATRNIEIIIFLGSLVILIGCVSFKDIKKCECEYIVKMSTAKTDFTEEERFVLTLPCKASRSTQYPTSGSIYKEFSFTYADSSVFAIKNAKLKGSVLNLNQRFLGNIILSDLNEMTDTLEFKGKGLNANSTFYWAEKICDHYIFAFQTSSPEKVSIFRQAAECNPIP